MSRAFKSKHSKAMDAKEECKTIIKNLFAERARKGLPNDDVKDMSLIVQKGGFADDGWFQLRSKLNFMLNSPTPAQGASSGYSSYGNWEASMQYVKSMVCDPAQYEKLYSSASWDDKDALAGLKRGFEDAKASGKKVEKRPEEWVRAKELVDRAKTGKKPQQARSAFQSHIDDFPSTLRQELESTTMVSIRNDISELKNSGLLEPAERNYLDNLAQNGELLMFSKINGHGERVSNLKHEVAQRKAQQKEKTSILDRCNALLKSGKLTIEEEDALRDMKSDAKMGVNLTNIRSDLDKLDKIVAARNVKIDVDGALAAVLAPENAKFIPFEALECIKCNLPGRGALAEDWFAARVAEVHAELLENKERGTIANGAEKPENKALIARIDAVLGAKTAGNSKLELEAYKFGLQRGGLDSPSLQMLEQLLKQGEAKMNISKATTRALALDGLTSGEKDIILRMSGAQPAQSKGKPLSARLERERQKMIDIQNAIMNGAQKNSDAGKPTLNDGTIVHNPLFLYGKIEKLLDAMAKLDMKKANGMEKIMIDEIFLSLANYKGDIGGGLDLRLLPKYVGFFNNLETRMRPILAKQGIAYGEQGGQQMTAGQLASKVLALRPALAKAFASCDEQDELEIGNLLARLNMLKDNMSARQSNEKPASEQKSFMSIQNAAMPYLKKYGVECASQTEGVSAQAASSSVKNTGVESRSMRPEIALERIDLLKNAILNMDADITSTEEDNALASAYHGLSALELEASGMTTVKIKARFLELEARALPVLRTQKSDYVPFEQALQPTAEQAAVASAQAGPAISPQALMDKADELHQALTTALLDSNNNINNEKMRAIRERVDSLKTQLWGNVLDSEMPKLIERFLANQKAASTYLEIYEVDYAPLKVGKASEAAQEKMTVGRLNRKIEGLASELTEAEENNPGIDGDLVDNLHFMLGQLIDRGSPQNMGVGQRAIEKLGRIEAEVHRITSAQADEASNAVLSETEFTKKNASLMTEIQHALDNIGMSAVEDIAELTGMRRTLFKMTLAQQGKLEDIEKKVAEIKNRHDIF